MKKLILSLSTVVIVISSVILSKNSNAQFGDAGGESAAVVSASSNSNCADYCFNGFAECADGNGINYTVTRSGSTIYIYGLGSYPPGQLTSCVAQYNSSKSSCASAPTIVVTSPKSRGKS